jgi:N-acetylglucosamine-6-phosphate deacetylase
MLLAGELALGGRIAPGWIEVDGTRVAGIAHGPVPREPDERVDGVLAPGLCDLQVNGGAGHEVTGAAGSLDAIDALALAHGVTSYLPTLVSPDDRTAERALEALAPRAADPSSPVAGVHLEGPFLSPAHAGVHPLDRLRSPAEGMPSWVEHPAVRLVTLAPELPGAIELIERLAARGIAVALGHSGASAAVARAAVDAGARLVTHVFNAMGPLHHRAPGLAGIALTDDRVGVGVIADGRHVDPVVLELIRRSAGPRSLLVTDATPAAGAPAGSYAMAGVAFARGEDGSARTPDGRLAGSTLVLDEALRTWEAMTGATLAESIFAASEAPAAAASLPSAATAGGPADFVLFDAEARVRRVMSHGRWRDGHARRPYSPAEERASLTDGSGRGPA